MRLQLVTLAFIPAKFLRTLALPEQVKRWSVTKLCDRLVKIGARIIRHGRVSAPKRSRTVSAIQVSKIIGIVVRGVRSRSAQVENRPAHQIYSLFKNL